MTLTSSQLFLALITLALIVTSSFVITYHVVLYVVTEGTKTKISLSISVKKLSSPILRPSGEGYDAKAVYNPSVVRLENGTYLMFYRAQASWRGTSVIMMAKSYDGIHFNRTGIVALEPTLKEELLGGCEDPRIVKVNDTWYMTYTAYDGKVARLALAVSKDLMHWEKLGILFPEWGWSKSGAILPVKIRGKYVMYFGDSNIWIAYSEDMVHWIASKDWVVLRPRPGYFDSKLVEPGSPPILTEKGILLIYNGANELNVYSTGWVLFSLDDPSKVIARSEEPILKPEQLWEVMGQVPNVVFTTSLIVVNRSTWYIYYGAADTYVGLAKANVSIAN
ncbi:MAG: glycosidase [Thermoprotei archaeon]|nr:MAG: glycosidase [Thermoprotei archaeon]